MAVAFDTLKLARKLEGAGFSREQASGAAEALAETFTGELATKTDLAALRAEQKADIGAVRNEIALLRGEVAALRAATVQWIIVPC